MTGLTQGLMKRVDTTCFAEMVLGDVATKLVCSQRVILGFYADLGRRNRKRRHDRTLATADRAVAAHPPVDPGTGESEDDGTAMTTSFIFLH